MMEQGRVYLDNAATTFPKPPAVHEAMVRYATQVGASPGRGSYAESVEGAGVLARTREALSGMVGLGSPEHVIFTLNATDALNLAIKGIVQHAFMKRGEPAHVVTTWMDHNSVLRPLNELEALGMVRQTRIKADPSTGLVDRNAMMEVIRPTTALVAMVHASNVCGALQPVRGVGKRCRKLGVPLLVDAAQTLGHMDVTMDGLYADLLAFPGHKGLMGPLGTGALCIRPGLEDRMRTVREGGTGSASEADVQPTFMPDRFEAGSHNTLGIAGLLAGIDWIEGQGLGAIEAHERELCDVMLGGLSAVPGLRVLAADAPARVGVFALVHERIGPNEMAAALEREHGVLGRAGLHCAPLAHRTFGTTDGGALRLSVGPLTTREDAELACAGVRAVCERQTAAAAAGA